MPPLRADLNIPSNDEEFEILCLKLLRLRWKRPQLQQHGKRGERQHGVDLIDTSGESPLFAAQCKRHEAHKTIPPQEIEDEVQKAIAFRPALDHYAILTTARVSAQAQKKIVEINQRHKSSGLFTVELLHWRDIEQMLHEFPDLRDELYGGIAASQVARMQQGINDLGLAVKSIAKEPQQSVPSNADDEAVLDEAKAALEQHDYQVARLLLQRLRKKRWNALTPRQRFRLLSNLGAVNLNELQPEEAANCFWEARVFQPEDEKALTNEALAHFLRGNFEQAHTLAGSLRKRFPDSAQLLSIWIQSAPATATHLELAAGLPEHLLTDSAVAVSLTSRALQRLDFDYVESILRGIRTGRQNWAVVPALLAKAILGSEFHKNLSPDDSSSYEERRERLLEAEALCTKSIEFALAEKQPRAVVEALLDRSFLRTLLMLPSDAASDVEQAFKLAPEDPSVMGLLAEVKRMSGDLEAAITLLRTALQATPTRVDFKYQLAAALRARGKPGDYREAADLLVPLANQAQMPPTGREHACMLAMDCLCRDERFEEAQRFIDSLSAGLLSPLSSNTIQARLHLSRKDVEKANSATDAAVAAMTPTTTKDELDYLAGLLSDLGRHSEALPLWQKVVRPGEVGSDPKRLLNTAYRLQRHDIVLDVCGRLRKAGAYSADLLQYEVRVLEQYDPDEAIRLLQEHLRIDHDDLATQLHLSMIAHRVGRTDLVCSDPSRMPPPHNVTPFLGAVAVQILKLYGKPDEALKYAYDLLRLHFHDPIAHRAYQFVLMPFGFAPTIEDQDVVQIGSAVTVTEDVTGEERTFVIEETPASGPRFQDQLAPNTSLAREMIGKRAGETVVLAAGSLALRTGKLTKVLNKYVSRYQDSISNWQIRFPDDAGIESVTILRKQDDTPDISFLLSSLDRRQESAQKMREVYHAKPIPIHMFANQFGKSAWEGICMMATEEGFLIDCSLGSREEISDALQNLRISNEIVLEMTAIGTLALLNIESVLQNLGIQVLVSQATINELTEMVANQERETAEGGYLAKVGDRYVFKERNADEHQAHVRRLKALLSTIRSSTRIVPGREAINLEPAKRDLLHSAFGRYGTESILLASLPGRILWTDDHRIARFARTEYGVRRIWTQALLQHCLETGKITHEDFSSASAKLVGFEYVFTSLNPNTLMSASRIAAWEPARWPLRQAIAQFGSVSVDLVVLLRLALLFIIQLYREPIAVEVRDTLFTAILDSLALKPNAIAALQGLRPKLIELFALNAVGAQQADECLRRWLDSRDFKV